LQISIIGNLPALQQPITSLLLEKSVNLMCLLHSRDILKKKRKNTKLPIQKELSSYKVK